MTTPLLVLVGGVVFVVGFAAGSAVFARILRRRERRLDAKAKAVESARRYLLRHGIDLPAWAASAADRDHDVRFIRRPRWWRRFRKGGRHHA